MSDQSALISRTFRDERDYEAIAALMRAAALVDGPECAGPAGEGMHWAMLSVDAENPTGALRLYEGVDFHPARQSATFRKTVRS